MYGLEASNDNSCPSSQSRATARPRRAVDAATRLVAPDCLIAPGAGCPIPSLSGVSTEYRFVDGLDTVAALGKSLLTVGLAQVNAWTETKGDALRFVERTIQDELDQHGATEIEREFFFNFSVVSDLEAYGPERGEPDGELRPDRAPAQRQCLRRHGAADRRPAARPARATADARGRPRASQPPRPGPAPDSAPTAQLMGPLSLASVGV